MSRYRKKINKYEGKHIDMRFGVVRAVNVSIFFCKVTQCRLLGRYLHENPQSRASLMLRGAMSKILGSENKKVSEGWKAPSNYLFHYLHSFPNIIEETKYRIRLTGHRKHGKDEGH
jgi:hypothetical protein